MLFNIFFAICFSLAQSTELFSEYTDAFPTGNLVTIKGPVGLAAVYSKVRLPRINEDNYFTYVSSKNDYYHGKGYIWYYRDDGRISLLATPKKSCHFSKENELLFMRAVRLPTGSYQLRMVDFETPLAPGDLDTFSIWCKPSGTTECIIAVDGVVVPYFGKAEDVRPLVLDMANIAKLHGKLQLWPADNTIQQKFELQIVSVEEDV